MTLTDRERQLDEDLKNALAGLVRTEAQRRELVEATSYSVRIGAAERELWAERGRTLARDILPRR